jgi:TonB family protein
LRQVQQVKKALVVCFLLSSWLLANDRDDAQRLLSRSFQQTSPWKGSPVHINATFAVPVNGKPSASLVYSLAWSGPDKWRAEWSGEGYSKLTVVQNGIRHTYSNANSTPAKVMLIEQALGALDGFSPLGPFAPPLGIGVIKPSAGDTKIDGVQVKCVTPDQFMGKYCIDPTNATAVRNTVGNSTFTYADYVSMGELKYPQQIRIFLSGRETDAPMMIADGKVSLELGTTIPEESFQSPANARSSPYPFCADLDKSFVAPSADSSTGRPVYPGTARAKRQTGTVRIYLHLNEEGKLVQSSVYGSAGPELDQSALDAIRKWKFTPYTRCGKGIEVEEIESVNYTLAP